MKTFLEFLKEKDLRKGYSDTNRISRIDQRIDNEDRIRKQMQNDEIEDEEQLRQDIMATECPHCGKPKESGNPCDEYPCNLNY